MDICFWCRNDATNKAGKAPIYCTITVNSFRCIPFATGVKVVAKNWDTKKKTSRDEFRDVVRQELNEVETKIRQVKLLLEHSGQLLTAQLIRNEYLSLKEKQTKPKSSKSVSFFEGYRLHQKDKKELGASERTLKNDQTLYNNFDAFCKDIKKDKILLNQIDKALIESFKKHLRKKKISINHISRHVSLIKNILDFGVDNNLNTVNAISSMKLNYSDNLDPVGLDFQDILKIQNYQCNEKSETIAKDIFLFLCGSGIDYCDYINLKNEYLRVKNNKLLLRYPRKKTDTYKTDSVCEANPILKDCAVQVLNKYGELEKLPKIKNIQNVNRIIQRIGKALNIEIKLTTKRGRKTFTNLCINHKTDEKRHTDEQTAYQLGHTSTKQLKHYRKYNDSILDDLI